MATESISGEIGTEIQGRLGIITLNRPKALNALNLAMVERLDYVLTYWAQNPAIDAVLIRSVNERAFCAGGDMRSIGILPSPDERIAAGCAFFKTEYKVNYRIHTFPKPFIALINGVAMGGGLGLSVHGSHRVVSEDLRMAMPETVLGLFPDVGATWFLSRCPGAIGRYLGLVGPQIGAADALAAGLATHHLPLATFDALLSALTTADRLDAGSIDAILNTYATLPVFGTLAERGHEIDQLFAGDDLDTVIARIDVAAQSSPWVAEARDVLHRTSPTSLRATWRRLIAGAVDPIDRVLTDDYRMAVRIIASHDFAEGVRAILVDKDQSPRWKPATLDAVTDADIDLLLAPMANDLTWREE